MLPPPMTRQSSTPRSHDLGDFLGHRVDGPRDRCRRAPPPSGPRPRLFSRHACGRAARGFGRGHGMGASRELDGMRIDRARAEEIGGAQWLGEGRARARSDGPAPSSVDELERLGLPGHRPRLRPRSRPRSSSRRLRPGPGARSPWIGDRRARGSLACLGQQLLDGLVRVHDEGLLQQHHFLVELADAALDHLLDDRRRLAATRRPAR